MQYNHNGLLDSALLEITDFKASPGWLQKFKKRYNISAFNKHGEAQSAPIEHIPEMRLSLKAIIQQYQPNDVFNCNSLLTTQHNSILTTARRRNYT